jgi:hypothetical protein
MSDNPGPVTAGPTTGKANGRDIAGYRTRKSGNVGKGQIRMREGQTRKGMYGRT